MLKSYNQLASTFPFVYKALMELLIYDETSSTSSLLKTKVTEQLKNPQIEESFFVKKKYKIATMTPQSFY